MRETHIPSDLDGVRADKAVANLAGVSRSVSRRWCSDGSVRVDGAQVAPSDPVFSGQGLVHPDPPVDASLEPDSTVRFDVVYEDDSVALVDKPAGVVVHPGAGRTGGTLAAGILSKWPSVEGVGQPLRWGLVHRLDRETSGLLVVALTSHAYDSLVDAFAERRVHRSYYAGVQGWAPAETGTIDAPIRRDPQRPTRMTVHRSGRSARTHYRRTGAATDGGEVLEMTLETGRTHQIRVHLSKIGLPVIGDRLYGWRGSGWTDRIWLHARRLSFPHPVTGEPVRGDAALPADLAATLDEAGLSALHP